ncbi:bifunctional metallophosphatase/5'-nucleotidase [Mycoplasma seminis]|uniref:Bifunctional UDP-sugar hydrolase/5'-nucleotidase n=1 Tax=Mycoplasma seminis TaxID=512749 RepID=A0ABY9H9V0_9MOLU|nr:bifunctional UDP-sugar hydrolase/5'-nucleotidase [Mycoplasma seminis]WLP85354.1 bifunctional UDP-sugar hydrolase/5'-nucleotidase [Mycoplasma seminis]
MKPKSKWFLNLLPLTAVAITLPLATVACSKNDSKEVTDLKSQLEEIKKQKTSSDTDLAAVKAKLSSLVDKTKEAYKSATKDYDNKLAELAKVLKEAKTEKDADKKAKKMEALKHRVYKELKPLVYRYNALFKQLRETEKIAESKVRTIKIYHSNDEHGRIEFDDGKYSLYSGMLRTGLYLEDKDRDLLLSAGDMIQGLPLSDTDKGKTIANMAKNIGYQAVAVGNHEFDYGLKHVLDLNNELNPDGKEIMPFLSANIYYKHLDKAIEGYDESKVGSRVFKPYIIKQLANGMKTAIFGLTTPDTSVTSHPRNSQLVQFTEPVEEANKVVEEIRAAHPDINFIICIAHLGKGRSNAAWTSEYLAAHSTNELDLIIDGHSHTYIKLHNKENPHVYITQTEAYTKYLGDIEIEFDTESGKIVGQRQVLRDIYQIEVATMLDELPQDSENMKLLQALKAIYKEANDKVVFNLPVDLLHIDEVNVDRVPYWRGRVEPTGMGQLFANAGVWNFMQSKPWEAMKTEPATLDNTFGLMNGGGLRANLAKGDIKYGDMRAISPFGNRPNTVKVKGSAAIEAITYGLSKARSGGFSQLSSNISYEVEIKKEMNPKTQKEEYMWHVKPESIKINGKAFDPEKDYYISTNDYLAAGGDGYTMLNYVKDPAKVTLMKEGQSLLDESIDYINHVIKNKDKLDVSKLEKSLEEYAGKEINKNQIVNIPKEADLPFEG